MSGRSACLVTLTAISVALACGGAVEDPLLSSTTDAATGAADATTPPTRDATVSPPATDSAPPPPPVASIPCGDGGTCDPNAQVCCVTFMGQQASTSCVAKGTCKGSSFGCTSAANCGAGEVCCGSLQGGQSVTATCKPQCQGGFQEPQLCANSAECKTPGETCQPAFGGLSTCRGGGGPTPKDAGPG